MYKRYVPALRVCRPYCIKLDNFPMKKIKRSPCTKIELSSLEDTPSLIPLSSISPLIALSPMNDQEENNQSFIECYKHQRDKKTCYIDIWQTFLYQPATVRVRLRCLVERIKKTYFQRKFIVNSERTLWRHKKETWKSVSDKIM